MALAGELAKYVGNELVKGSGKGVAKAGARSVLSSLFPSAATKAREGVLRNILVGQSKSVAEKIPVATGDAGGNFGNKVMKEMRGGSAPKVQQSLELSPEQLEFFKDSKLRDANGQLIPVYHSTPANFTVFDNAKLGENTGYDNTALGHFVTTDKDFSRRFKDIDGKGIEGRTMELYANVKNPITHPYMARQKYDEAELDKIVEDYLMATDNQEFLQTLKEYAEEDGSTIYDEYMDMTSGGDSPFEFSGDERDLLQNKGYDAVEIVEGPKSGLVEGSNDNTPVSSYAIFDGANLKDIRNLNPTSNPDIRMSYGYGGGYGSYDENVKRIGSSEVASIDPETLPAGYEAVKKYLQTNHNTEIERLVGAKVDDFDVFPAKLKEWIEGEGYEASANVVNNLNIARKILDERMLDEMNMAGASGYRKFLETRSRLQADNPHMGLGPRSYTISANDDQIYQTDAAKLDREYSDRLGIGKSHTPMSDKVLSSDAQGYYMAGGIGINPLYASGESGVSTIGHERMHAWQDINKGEWDSRVVDAIDELREELKNHYHTKSQIKEYRKSGADLDYYVDDKEQEARMLQSYLDNEGFTNTYRKNSEGGTEWGDEIKPAFDRFFNKLRALSKKGVALPAIAGLVGIGALAGKKDDKSIDNIE